MSSSPSTLVLDLTPMTVDQAKAILRRLLGSYPQASATDPEVYVSSLIALFTGYPIWAGERAIEKVLDTSKFLPTRAEIKPLLEETVRVQRYAADWEQDAAVQLESRTKLLGGPRERRLSYDELKAKYGPNWGISGAEARPVETAAQAEDKLVAIAGQQAFDACPPTGYDPRKAGTWKGIKAPAIPPPVADDMEPLGSCVNA